MTTTTPSTVLAVPDLVFTDPERLALAGFLAGHRGLTRDAYALDLRQFVSWCERHSLKLFSVHRTDIELYARALEEAGRPGPLWPGACALWRASTATPKRKVWSRSPRLSTSGVPGSTTRATLSASTATRSVLSSSLLVSARQPSTPSSHFWR